MSGDSLNEDYSFLDDDKDHPICQKMYASVKASKNHAFFYKLRDKEASYTGDELESKYFSQSFPDKDSSSETGSVYSPPNSQHTWRTNLAWVLGLVHKGRSVKINSRLTDDYIWTKSIPSNDQDEQDNKSRFSAFSKEIAALKKAGYTVKFLDQHIFMQSPEPQPNLTTSQIDPSNDEVRQSITELMNLIFQEMRKTAAIKKIDNYGYHVLSQGFIEQYKDNLREEDKEDGYGGDYKKFNEVCNGLEAIDSEIEEQGSKPSFLTQVRTFTSLREIIYSDITGGEFDKDVLELENTYIGSPDIYGEKFHSGFIGALKIR